ncbi:alpha carbonic anhydrase 4-like isoform X2 [Cicer arietinum]|uniref:Carbonic anhydrase n=1 Tax=Cicer arietinum TaxID=3827 RepID=A0A1S2XTP7_CICAR|nr:alpha carbonic anhydrase 4-like isoform X2 [Cicer arietinum]
MILPKNPNLFSFIFLLLILSSSSSSFLVSASDSTTDEYNYKVGSKEGPENWGNMKPEWKVCGIGKLQSPIDICNKRVQEFPQLGILQRDYKPAPAVLLNRGHDVMVQWNGDAGNININGTYYKLVQCHWHTPSEHTLSGSKYDMELHAVHKSSTGETAVIGVWYKIGKPDPFLSKLLDQIKLIDDKEIDVGTINPADIKFANKKYYRYIGSLTTPPCTEGVTWTIVKKVKTASIEQIIALKEAVHRGFEENARPTQNLGAREVWLYASEENKKST